MDIRMRVLHFPAIVAITGVLLRISTLFLAWLAIDVMPIAASHQI